VAAEDVRFRTRVSRAPPFACSELSCVGHLLPDLNGLDLQSRIAADRSEMPIIFITGCGDVPTTVRAMKAGAVEFLTKPFKGDILRAAICQALERSRIVLDRESEMVGLKANYDSLNSTRTSSSGIGRGRPNE